MSTFRIVKYIPVVTYREEVLLETDDWLAAEAEVERFMRTSPITMARDLPRIVGVHPSHDFDPRKKTCRNEGCRSWNNGSYGSHAPCGTVFTEPLSAMVAASRAAPTHDRAVEREEETAR